jgi:tetratricopeptide (TPR) repeat protein
MVAAMVSTDALSRLKTARDAWQRDQDPDEVLRQLHPLIQKLPGRDLAYWDFTQTAAWELAGLALRDKKQFNDAIAHYKKMGNHYLAGYCHMLTGNSEGARQEWIPLASVRQNHWCITLYGLIHRQLSIFPTMFQIRNNIETDIYNLIQANQLAFLENILAYQPFLSQINMETPKMMGRALMNAGWIERCESFLYLAQKAIPHDPEIYFHLGQYHVLRKNWDEARLMLHQCLMITSTYNPARRLLETIE